MNFSLARLNALALGWAINLIVIFISFKTGGDYAFLALIAAWVADTSEVMRDRGFPIPAKATLLASLASIALTAIAAFCLYFDIITN